MPPRPGARHAGVPAPVLLDARRSVTVTREEHHQDVLAQYAPAPGSTRRIVADLAFCRIGAGRYRGERGIEVRLGGRRVGELTHRMSERYAGTVGAVLGSGRRPDCEALVKHGDRGLEVELWLPDASEPAPTVAGPVEPVTDRLPQVPVPRGTPPPTPSTAVLPRRGGRPDQTSVVAGPAPAASGASRPTPSRPGIVLEPRRRRLRKTHWAAASAVGVVLLAIGIGAGDGGEDPAEVSAKTSTTLPDPTPVPEVPIAATPTLAPTTTGRAATPPRAPSVAAERAAPTTTRARAATPTTTRPAAPAGCSPNYSGCLPITDDLNCTEVTGTVQVLGRDIYRLDGDGDGYACNGS
jgi:hypothetical protein